MEPVNKALDRDSTLNEQNNSFQSWFGRAVQVITTFVMPIIESPSIESEPENEENLVKFLKMSDTELIRQKILIKIDLVGLSSCRLVNKEWSQLFLPYLMDAYITRLPSNTELDFLVDLRHPLNLRIAYICSNVFQPDWHTLFSAKRYDDTMFDQEINGKNCLEIVYDKYKNNPQMLAGMVKINRQQIFNRVPDSFFSRVEFVQPLIYCNKDVIITKKVMEMIPEDHFNDLGIRTHLFRSIVNQDCTLIDKFFQKLGDAKYDPFFFSEFCEQLDKAAFPYFKIYYKDKFDDGDFMLMALFNTAMDFKCKQQFIPLVSDRLKKDLEFGEKFEKKWEEAKSYCLYYSSIYESDLKELQEFKDKWEAATRF